MTTLLPEDIEVLADALVKKSMLRLDADDELLMKKMMLIAVEDTQLTVDGTVTMKEWHSFLMDDGDEAEVDEPGPNEATLAEALVFVIIVLLAAWGVSTLVILAWKGFA